MGPSYSFIYEIEEVGMALIPLLVSGIPSGLFEIAAYVLSSIALYTLATRRGINHPWLSWVPVLNCWVLGSLSDQYRYVVRGEIKSKRKILLTLNLITCAVTLIIALAVIGVVITGITGSVYGMNEEALLEEVFAPVLGIAGLALPLAGVTIASLVFRYMAMYDLYTSCDPRNNVVFTVLSILFHVTEPFFLFFNRNKDEGMPPRRQEPVSRQDPQWHYQEVWEQKDYL